MSSIFGTLVTGLGQRETWQYQYNHLNQSPQCTKASFPEFTPYSLRRQKRAVKIHCDYQKQQRWPEQLQMDSKKKFSIEKRNMYKANPYFFFQKV